MFKDIMDHPERFVINAAKPVPDTQVSNAVARNCFDRAFDRIETELPMNQAWKNDTGYMNFAVRGQHMVNLVDDELVKTYDDVLKRKAIFVGTPLGPIVLFQRYSESSDVITVCLADDFRAMQIPGFSGALSSDTIDFALGQSGEGVGAWINRVASILKDVNKPEQDSALGDDEHQQ